MLRPHSAPGLGQEQQPLIKSLWTQCVNGSTTSLLPSQDMFQGPQGVFQQPLVQCIPKLVPPSPFLMAHQDKHQDLWPQSHQTDDNGSLDSYVDGQQRQSLLQLLEQ